VRSPVRAEPATLDDDHPSADAHDADELVLDLHEIVEPERHARIRERR
jgi:hypothetical protein